MNMFRKQKMAVCVKCGVYFLPKCDPLPFADHCEPHREPLIAKWHKDQAITQWALGDGRAVVEKAYEEARIKSEGERAAMSNRRSRVTVSPGC